MQGRTQIPHSKLLSVKRWCVTPAEPYLHLLMLTVIPLSNTLSLHVHMCLCMAGFSVSTTMLSPLVSKSWPLKIWKLMRLYPCWPGFSTHIRGTVPTFTCPVCVSELVLLVVCKKKPHFQMFAFDWCRLKLQKWENLDPNVNLGELLFFSTVFEKNTPTFLYLVHKVKLPLTLSYCSITTQPLDVPCNDA